MTPELRTRLLSIFNAEIADLDFPEAFEAELLSCSTLFLPVQSYRSVDMDGLRCGIRLLHAPSHECFAASLHHHLNSGDDWCLGYVFDQTAWISHAWCYNPTENILIEPTFPSQALIYWGVRGSYQPKDS